MDIPYLPLIFHCDNGGKSKKCIRPFGLIVADDERDVDISSDRYQKQLALSAVLGFCGKYEAFTTGTHTIKTASIQRINVRHVPAGLVFFFSSTAGQLNLYHSRGQFSRRQIGDIFLIFPRKQDLKFHTNWRQFV